ncbi:MAG TPA: type 4a pilus biogenesis protein PilO [Capsulimonadaceae bacterium]|nr:type 4a pilus biogenesis protein PilO [Capsulimonadaceae bacterium]
MFDFKQKERLLPSILIVVSLVIAAGAALFASLAPVPGGPAVGSNHTTTRRRMEKDIKLAQITGDKASKELHARLWQGNSESVSAGVLAQITKASSQQSLKLGAFRPQRTQPLGAVTEMPYAVQLSGPYPGIRAVMSSLDSANSKIVLRSVQLASSEQGTNTVSATLGVSAYLATDPSLVIKKAPPAKTGSKVAQSRPGVRSAARIGTTGGTHG